MRDGFENRFDLVHAGLPGVVSGFGLVSGGTGMEIGGLIFSGGGLQCGGELLWRIGEAHVLRVVAEAGHRRGNDGLASGEVFEKFDRVQRFGELRDFVRRDQNIEGPHGVGNARISDCGEDMDAAAGFEGTAFGFAQEIGAEEGEGAGGEGSGADEQVEVEAVGVKRAGVAVDGAREMGEIFGDGAGLQDGSIVASIDTVFDQVQAARGDEGLLEVQEFVGADDGGVGAAAEAFIRGDGAAAVEIFLRERNPIVGDVVNEGGMRDRLGEVKGAVGVDPEDRIAQAKFAGGGGNVAAKKRLVDLQAPMSSVRTEAERRGEGDIRKFGNGVHRVGEEGAEVAGAEVVGGVAGKADEEDLHARMAAREGCADELVSAPDVVPVFEGEKDEVRGGHSGAQLLVEGNW